MPNFLTRVSTRAQKAQQVQRRPSGRLRVASAESERWNMPDPTKVEQQVRLYGYLSWIQIAISHVAHAVAKTPFQVYQSGGADLKVIKTHPFLDLLRNPNPLQSRYELWDATISWKKAAGNCYWWLNRATEDAPPDEIWIIPAQYILPVPDGNMDIKGYLYDDGAGNKEALDPWEVVHFKTWNPFNKYVGLSAIQSLMLDSMGDIGAQEYAAKFYDKGRIKMKGILAFADMVDDGKWKRLDADWQEQAGGKQNKGVIKLRGVGTGVNWIPTELSQAETQYLEVRAFTKEEIFALLAPGLSSILAINATEANSTAGKDTFLEQAVAPELSVLDEKITQKLLPVYGDGLIAQFDSVERVDTEIELKEQEEYAKTHTVDEVRAKYYQDKALGDERGGLLPAEIGKGLTDARKPEDKPPPPAFGQQQPAQIMDIQTAGKALDRQRWRTVAMKALAAGRSPDSRTFDPDYLTDDEAMQIRGMLRRATTEQDIRRAFE